MKEYNPNNLNHKTIIPLARKFEDNILHSKTGVEGILKRVRILKNATAVFSYFVDTGDKLSKEFVYDSIICFTKSESGLIESSLRTPFIHRATREFRAFQSAVFYCETVKSLDTKAEREMFIDKQKVNFPNINGHISSEPHNVVKYYENIPFPNVPEITFKDKINKGREVKLLFPSALVMRNSITEVTLSNGTLVGYKSATLKYSCDAPRAACSFPLILNDNNKHDTIQRALLFLYIHTVPSFVIYNLMLARNIILSKAFEDLNTAKYSLKKTHILNVGQKRRIKSIIKDIEDKIEDVEKPLIHTELLIDSFTRHAEKKYANLL